MSRGKILSVLRPGKGRQGFTLVELLAVIVIIILLGTFTLPVWKRAMIKAQSQACAANLRGIGIAVQLAVQDNNGFYPNIEPDPSQPIYLPEEDAQSLADTLKPYSVEGTALRCPADVANNDYYTLKGTSYEWRPMVDGEPASNPTLIFRRGTIIKVSPSRVRLVTDFEAVHNGRQNAVFADGRVKMY